VQFILRKPRGRTYVSTTDTYTYINYDVMRKHVMSTEKFNDPESKFPALRIYARKPGQFLYDSCTKIADSLGLTPSEFFFS
jgi:hypothetical protein